MRGTVNEYNDTRIGDTKRLNCDYEKMWFNERLIPSCTVFQFLSIFFDFSSTALKISLFLSSLVRRLTLVVLDSSFKTEGLLYNMTTASQIWRVEHQDQSFFTNGTDWTLSSHFSLWLLSSLSVYLSLSYTGPSVDLRPPSDSFILSFRLTMPAAVQDTTLEGVLSSCGCSFPLTLTTSMGIWHSAGVTKGVTSPAAHRGIWHDAGVTKSWLPSATLKKSFAWSRKYWTHPKISIWLMRETRRVDSHIRIGDTKQLSWCVKGCGANSRTTREIKVSRKRRRRQNRYKTRNQDFVAPAAYHIPLWAAKLVTPFVSPALRENAFWCCVLNW